MADEKKSTSKKDEPQAPPVRDPSLAIPPDVLPRYLQPKKLL